MREFLFVVMLLGSAAPLQAKEAGCVSTLFGGVNGTEPIGIVEDPLQAVPDGTDISKIQNEFDIAVAKKFTGGARSRVVTKCGFYVTGRRGADIDGIESMGLKYYEYRVDLRSILTSTNNQEK